MQKKENYTKILLVEGKNDKHVLWALLKKYKIPNCFDIIDCGGIEPLKGQISIRFKAPNIDTVGVIIDADTDIHSRWESVKSKLSEMGFVIPDNLPEEGLVVKDGNRKAGVWIMPDNKTNGMLEDFISFLIPEEDSLRPLAESTLESIEKDNLNKYNKIHHSKAFIHTWLAWQEEPGIPMGQSITQRYLNVESERCQKLINWIKKTFVG